MTTNNPQPQPMEQPPMEQPPMQEQPLTENNEMEEGGQVKEGGQVEEQIENTPDRLILNWGAVYTFFK